MATAPLIHQASAYPLVLWNLVGQDISFGGGGRRTRTDLKMRAKMMPPRLPDAPTTPVISPLLNLEGGVVQSVLFNGSRGRGTHELQ
jgi:hypothetical protein